MKTIKYIFFISFFFILPLTIFSQSPIWEKENNYFNNQPLKVQYTNYNNDFFMASGKLFALNNPKPLFLYLNNYIQGINNNRIVSLTECNKDFNYSIETSFLRLTLTDINTIKNLYYNIDFQTDVNNLHEIISFSLSPENKKIVMKGIDSLYVYDLLENTYILKAKELEINGENYTIKSAAFYGEDTLVMILNKNGSGVFISQLNINEMTNSILYELTDLNYKFDNFSLGFHNSFLLLSNNTNKNMFYIYDMNNNKLYMHKTLGANKEIKSFYFSNENDSLVSYCRKGTDHLKKLYDSVFICNFINNRIEWANKLEDNKGENEYRFFQKGNDTIFLSTIDGKLQSYSHNGLDTVTYTLGENTELSQYSDIEILGNKFLSDGSFFDLSTGEKYSEISYANRKKLNDNYYIQNTSDYHYGVYSIETHAQVYEFELDNQIYLGNCYTSPNNKYFMLNNYSDSLWFYSIESKGVIIKKNAEGLDWRWLNDELYYCFNTFKDTAFIQNINNDEERLLAIAIDEDFSNITADNNYIYYFENNSRKLIRIDISDFSREEFDLYSDIKNLQVSFDKQYLYGISPYNTILIYDLTDLSLYKEIAYQCPYIVHIYLSADNKYMISSYEGFRFLCFNLETMSVNEENSKGKSILKIFPNPAEASINISSEQQEIPNEIAIYNLSGEQLISMPYKSEIDINSLNSGTYYIKLIYKAHSVTGKFVKE